MVPGDWVNTYYSGVWQIHRLLPIRYEMRFSLSERRKKSHSVIVFARRILNASWHKAFKTASCEQSLVSPLSVNDRARLGQLLEDDEELRIAFERYEPEPVPLLVNLTMGIPNRSRLEEFCRDTLSPAMVSGLSLEEVLGLLEDAGMSQFIQQYPIRATLQMVCPDHETRDGEFVLRGCRVLPF